MRTVIAALLVFGLLASPAAARPLDAPVAHAAATCSDYANQAAAQRAADTVDADGDGLYCESLPCPCLKPGDDGGSTPAPEAGCSKPSGVQSLRFSKAKYPRIRAHALAAIRAGWPSVLVLNRPGADARRSRLLEAWATRAGYDRDEYPPAVGRGRGKGLVGGSDPRGWRADVAYVPSHENRSHGSVMGADLRGFCGGTKFRYVFF